MVAGGGASVIYSDTVFGDSDLYAILKWDTMRITGHVFFEVIRVDTLRAGEDNCLSDV